MKCSECKFSHQRNDNTWWCGLTLPPHLSELIFHIERECDKDFDRSIDIFHGECDLGKES